MITLVTFNVENRSFDSCLFLNKFFLSACLTKDSNFIEDFTNLELHSPNRKHSILIR